MSAPITLSLPAVNALYYISRAGYLLASDIALLLFPGKASGVQLARRLLKPLVATKLLEAVTGPGNVLVYAITRRGCNAVLSELGETVSPTVALLKNLGNFGHRCIANSWSIRHLRGGIPCTVFFEYEIQQGKFPVYQTAPAKLPDYAVIYEDGVFWGEVECSKRSTTDRRALVNWLLDVLQSPPGMLPEIAPGLYLRQVEFIAPPEFDSRLFKWVVDGLVGRGAGEVQAEHRALDLLDFYTIVRQ